ncbi:MAG: lamin tail domain-containing protein [Flavobacteriales bacterium]|nr:lamin tail domain-containing protein [Flavobacteriales bacterium]
MRRPLIPLCAWRPAIAGLALCALLPHAAQAQLNVAALNTPYTITFDATVAGVNNGAYTGAGFQAAPTAGQLNSNAWATTGMSDGALAFGGARTSGDNARGTNSAAGGTSTGGFYAFTAPNIGSSSFGIKPGSDDWTPGTVTLRLQNTTGAAITSLDVAYELWNNNSQARSNSFNFSWSTDDASYTTVPALNFTSPAASDGLGYVVVNRASTISGLNVANNAYIYLRWNGDDVGGSGSRDEFALDDISVTGFGAGGPNTSVQFATTSGSMAENGGSTSLILSITDPDALNATTVDVVLLSGNAARINNYTTQTVTFPAGSASDETVTITVTDNGDCDGNAPLSFQIQNITGGQGTAHIGANDGYALEVQDNEAPADPVTTAGTAVASDGFTANWNAVNGATNHYLDVYTASPTNEDDFNDGDFTGSPTWGGQTSNYAVLTNSTVPGGSAVTDGSYLGSNASSANTALLMPSSETAEWKFSLASPGFDPSGGNYFGVVLMASNIVSDISESFNGYYLKVGVNGAVDPVELWRSDGTTKTMVGSFPASPNFTGNALTNGIDARVTRSGSGVFELFTATGFTYAATPTTSAGTLTDNTYSSTSYFGAYTNFSSPSATRCVYLDNIVLGGTPVYVPDFENFDAGVATSAMITGLDPLTTYHYRVRSSGGCSTGNNSNVTDVTTLAGITPALVAGALGDHGAVCLGAEGGPLSFTLDGFNLTADDVTVGPLDGFSFSDTEFGTYSSAQSISQPGGSFSQTIWVKLTPVIEQSYNGDIPVGGGGAPGILVAASGSGINTAPTVTTGGVLAGGSDQAELGGTIDDAGCSAVTGYGIEYSTTENFTPGTGTQVPSTNESGGAYSSVITGLAPCTVYYYVAYATNNGGTAYGAESSFETDAIGAPVATAPGTIGQDSFTATWDAVSGAIGYRLDVSTSPTFGNTVAATDLFFSEYVEGGGSNKYVEVYNGTGAAVDLSQYELQLFSNGASSPTTTESLSGTLADGATVVYANASASAYGGAVITSSAVNFNGDDAFALYNTGTSTFADIIGKIGEDPGSSWTGTGGRSTADQTLVRNATVTAGVAAVPVAGFPTLDTEWAVFDQDDVTHLGAHTFDNLVPDLLPGYNDLAVAGTSQPVAGLNTSTTYYYRVRTESGACVSGNSNTMAATTLPCGGNSFVVAINTDGNADQLTWEVLDGSNVSIATGGPYTGQNNTLVTETVCLGSTPEVACYSFHLYDSFGDGLSGVGNWELRTLDGKVLLADDFATGYSSPSLPAASPGYGSHHSFCLPEGPANIAANECGIFNNAMLNKVYCNKVAGANQYQFELSDPDAGFVRRFTTSRNYMRFDELTANPPVPGVKYFVRVRSNVAGPVASAHWGSGCEMGLGIAETVTCSGLIPTPAYGHSCNEERVFNANTSYIYATPVVGADEYQFRIFNLDEGYDQTFTRSTYILQLKWTNLVAPPLLDGYTYNVEINVNVNGVYSGFCPSSCTITINNNPVLGGRLVQAMPAATLWPNPVRDGAVNLDITGLAEAGQQITVDVQDLFGKRVYTREFSTEGARFSTVLQLPGELATGVYLVAITAHGERTLQRLSIVR